MKNLLKPLVETPPVQTNESDGIIDTSTDHLKAIRYPNRIHDIAVVGKKSDWHRSFLIRPKYGGRFFFMIYPSGYFSSETLITRQFNLQAFNSQPVVLDITVPPSLRLFDKWEWKVYKTEGANDDEDMFDERDGLEISDGMLTGKSASQAARFAMREKSYSTLLYHTRPVITGEVSFEEERSSENAKIALWSCHQPYGSENGAAVIKQESERILTWYKSEMEKFSPHLIWMLGDSVYSDGTGSLDFVKQVYDKGSWHESSVMRKDLLSLYRLNYRYHWGFESMQKIMRKFPHLGMWDDHEIRDGYGSEESDFKDCNIAIKQIATQAAQEYLFQYSPVLRSETTKNSSVDKHQAYVNNPVAAFIFDGRNSRNYGENMPVPSEVPLLASTLSGLILGAVTGGVLGAAAGTAAGLVTGARLTSEIIDIYRWNNPGEVVSDLQLQDFQRFCNHIKGQAHIKYLLLGNSVPFIYILDFVEAIAAESALAGTDAGTNIRDDIRDSWHSPANRKQLGKLIEILRELHHDRRDIEIINLSGDIHISNAYIFQPEGFRKPLYQVTSSALTNNPPSQESFLNLISVGGPLSFNATSKELGEMERLWQVGKNQNFMTINADSNSIILHLHVYNKEDTDSPEADRILTIRPDQGYILT